MLTITLEQKVSPYGVQYRPRESSLATLLSGGLLPLKILGKQKMPNVFCVSSVVSDWYFRLKEKNASSHDSCFASAIELQWQ
jgi:hypothetical protein